MNPLRNDRGRSRFMLAVSLIALLSFVTVSAAAVDHCDDAHADTWGLCPVCEATGKVDCPRCQGVSGLNCQLCQAEGKVDCTPCGGTGHVKYHTHSYSSTVSNGACSGSVTTYTCSCGDTYTTGTKYDTHSYTSSTSGYITTYTCSRCGDSYTEDNTPAHTHSYTSKTVYGDCSGSVTTYTCSCGDSYSTGSKSDTHSYSSKVTRSATCTSTGVRMYTCSVCGDSYTSSIAKTSHTYVSHSAVAATCTASGNSAYYTCSTCTTVFDSSKKTISSIPTIAALGHSWGSWSTTKAATCESSGTQSHTCSRCSTTATQTIAATGHAYVSHAAKASTCTEQGWSAYHSCSKCTKLFNASKTEISAIPYLALAAHTYTAHSAKAATCTEAGNPLYYSCSVCSGLFDSSKKSITTAPTTVALGHSYSAKTYTWSTDLSRCTVGLECSRDSSHTSSISAVSTTTVTKDSDVLTTTVYSVSGTDPFSKVSYSATRTQYTHTAILRYELSGGSGSFPDQTASFTSETATPFGSKSLKVPSTKPTKSGEVFFGWAESSNGTVAYSAGASVPVSYGSITTLHAVFEPTLAWTSVPTASCIVKPAVSYASDGSYTLKSQTPASSADIRHVTGISPDTDAVSNADTLSRRTADGAPGVQHAGVLGSPVQLEFSSIADPCTMHGSPSGDPLILGGYIDLNYRDPPPADHTIGITDDLSFGSSDPAYTIRWTLTDSSGSDSDMTPIFANTIGLAKSGVMGKTYRYESEECLPSWITWDAGARSAETGWFSITIRPALQQVSEDTHGTYWIWFRLIDTNNLLGKERSSTYLVSFDVDVTWTGGVIVPERYSVFVLHLDYGFDSGIHNSTLSSGPVSLDTQEYRFHVDGKGVARDGYLYKGWSMSAGSPSTDVGEDFPLNTASAATRSSVDADGNTTYECTLYAVWEKVGDDEDDIVIPDLLQDILSLLSDPYVMALFMASVFGVAVLVRVRRQGMVRCGR